MITIIEPVRLRYSDMQRRRATRRGSRRRGTARRPKSTRPSVRPRNALTAGEQQRRADDLRVDGIDRAAPEVVPAGDGDQRRDRYDGVAEELERQLAQERADPAGEVGRQRRACPC